MSNPNLKQVYEGNPSTTLPGTALMYSFLSPYGSTDSTGILISDLKTQFSIFSSPDLNYAAQIAVNNIGELNFNSVGVNSLSKIKFSNPLDMTNHNIDNALWVTASNFNTQGIMTWNESGVRAFTATASGGDLIINSNDGIGAVSLTSHKIINLANPTNAQDGATKKYVDDSVNGTDTTVTCQFNAGSATGTTDFTAAFIFRKVGNLVTVLIPAVGFNVLNPSFFRTALSANPNCIPVPLRPSKTGYGFITTNSNGVVPLGSPGSFEVTNDGNITIYFQNTGGNFPASFWGGTGFAQSGDGRIQLMTYSLT